MRDKKKYSVGSSWLNQIKKNRCLLLMLFPVLLYFIVFCYIPMFGNIMAFEDYSVGKGFLHSEWVGFRWFREFFSSVYFGRLIKNTLLISIYSLIKMCIRDRCYASDREMKPDAEEAESFNKYMRQRIKERKE